MQTKLAEELVNAGIVKPSMVNGGFTPTMKEPFPHMQRTGDMSPERLIAGTFAVTRGGDIVWVMDRRPPMAEVRTLDGSLTYHVWLGKGREGHAVGNYTNHRDIVRSLADFSMKFQCLLGEDGMPVWKDGLDVRLFSVLSEAANGGNPKAKIVTSYMKNLAEKRAVVKATTPPPDLGPIPRGPNKRTTARQERPQGGGSVHSYPSPTETEKATPEPAPRVSEPTPEPAPREPKARVARPETLNSLIARRVVDVEDAILNGVMVSLSQVSEDEVALVVNARKGRASAKHMVITVDQLEGLIEELSTVAKVIRGQA